MGMGTCLSRLRTDSMGQLARELAEIIVRVGGGAVSGGCRKDVGPYDWAIGRRLSRGLIDTTVLTVVVRGAETGPMDTDSVAGAAGRAENVALVAGGLAVAGTMAVVAETTAGAVTRTQIGCQRRVTPRAVFLEVSAGAVASAGGEVTPAVTGAHVRAEGQRLGAVWATKAKRHITLAQSLAVTRATSRAVLGTDVEADGRDVDGDKGSRGG